MEVIRMSYEDIDQHREMLNTAATAGTLTEAMLDEAVELVVDPPRNDYLPKSLGCDWIWNHIAEFAKVVSDPLVFLRRHFENHYFTPLVVLRAELLRLLPESERAPYVRESIMHHGARNMGWIKAALGVGVSQEELAQIVLDRLQATAVKEGFANFLNDFLIYGCGQVEKINSLGSEGDRRRWRLEEDTEWSVLNADQFAQAIRICVTKSPAEVLRQYRNIRLRLDDETLQSVMIEAADKLDQVSCPEVLRTLPLETQIALARRIKKVDVHAQDVTAQLLVELILIKGISLYEEVRPVFEQMNAAMVYRNTFALLAEAARAGGQKKIVADKLEPLLADRCRADGYYFGVIQEGTYTKRGQQQRQKQVQDGGTTYVQDGMQHRYFPKVGEAVLFKPSQGHCLTPRVTAVMFYPACHGGEI